MVLNLKLLTVLQGQLINKIILLTTSMNILQIIHISCQYYDVL